MSLYTRLSKKLVLGITKKFFESISGSKIHVGLKILEPDNVLLSLDLETDEFIACLGKFEVKDGTHFTLVLGDRDE